MTVPSPDPDRPAKRSWIRHLGDWRIWLGLGITAIAIYWTLRGVELRDVGRTVAGADPWLLLAMLPCHVAALWLRAIRWRILTGAIADGVLPMGPLFRSTAVGFMALNVLPLRIGEILRPWLLARETGVRASAAIGTVLIERAIDFASVALVGGCVLALHTQTLPGWVRTGALLIAAASLVPFGMMLAVRLDEEGTLRLVTRLLSALPSRVSGRALDIVWNLGRGLASLRTTRDVGMVLFYSALLWGVLIPAPFLLGLFAVGIRMGAAEAAFATYTGLTFTAVAVAVPSAPGFFGVYHFACREALGLFAVSPAIAVGFGTLVHLAYWIPVTVVGLLALGRSRLHLADLTVPPIGKAGAEAHR